MKFLEHSPHIQGGTSFDQYVGHLASRMLLGPTTAERLAVFGAELLSEQTLDGLGLIADGTIKPSVPAAEGFRTEDTPAPLVRWAHDFEPDELVRYHTPEQASIWAQGNVDIGRLLLINMSKDRVLATGPLEDADLESEDEISERRTDFVIFVNSFGFNGVHFQPNWPGLMTEGLHHEIMARRKARTKDSPLNTWRAFGTALTRLSYFDEQATDPVFLTAITSTLRHFDAPTKKVS